MKRSQHEHVPDDEPGMRRKVLWAGTAHINQAFTDDFRYVGVYPVGFPQWRSELYDDADIMEEMGKKIPAVPLPIACPVMGQEGGLMELWGLRTAN
ncbi:hypothetical protein B0O99DRAFT_685539 [Bisporella sp. PMI_857]|nr:hypothetical protein B0O99DRAFT_685539 [Bisporella sp. PMI_857]